MADYKGVLVVGEVVDGKLAAITSELLGAGRGLADALGETLIAVLIGSNVKGYAQEGVAYGADKVYVVEDPLLEQYQGDSYLAVVEKLVNEVTPSIVLMGQTSIGRDLAPRLAFRLKSAASMDCVALGIDPDSKLLLGTRAVYGGNAQAIFAMESKPQIATVRAKAMEPLGKDDSRKGEVITLESGLDASQIRTRYLETVKEEIAGIKLEDAAIVVGGGRGIGGPDGFKELQKLATLLKGAVGATRPPCDNKWVNDTLQIGLTGKIVTPDVYIAVALSGSSQHLSGCSGSKNIIAINKDPEANIFKVARFGVVGDWKQAVPAFTEKVKELLAG